MSMTHLGVGGLLLPHAAQGGSAVVDPPVANFEANVLFGTVPFTVEFTNLTTGDGDITYIWDFGDGSPESTNENPSHEYATVGVYTVSLTASNAGGEDTETKTDYISAYREVTLVLQPDAAAGNDTSIVKNVGDNNFGITNVIRVGEGVGAGTTTNRGLIKFDLSSIPPGTIVDSAILALVCTAESSTTDYNVSVHRALVQWYEGLKNNAAPDAGQDGSTWNLRNTNGSVAWVGGAGGAAGSDWVALSTDAKSITGTGTTFDFDVIDDVGAFVTGAATNHGWALINDAEGTEQSRKDFASSDNATPANRPKLTIVYRTTTPA